jgi:hypothetical protein
MSGTCADVKQAWQFRFQIVNSVKILLSQIIAGRLDEEALHIFFHPH